LASIGIASFARPAAAAIGQTLGQTRRGVTGEAVVKAAGHATVGWANALVVHTNIRVDAVVTRVIVAVRVRRVLDPVTVRNRNVFADFGAARTTVTKELNGVVGTIVVKAVHP